MFIKYPKIHRLGKSEVEGILAGTCTIQEKVDGANISMWWENGEVKCASRSREITEGFNGFVDYVRENKAIEEFLKEHPMARLYGEWLVRHTISYNETAYKKIYLFDICSGDEENLVFSSQESVQLVAQQLGLEYPQIFGVLENPTVEQIQEFVGKSSIGDKGEGIVIKNEGFVNQWGSKCYAKMVTQEFLEDNTVTFGGNNKHSEAYWEQYIVNKYMTLARIQKIMHKIEPTLDKRLDLEHTPRITGQAYYDLITEECWEIAGKVGNVDFKKLKSLCFRKAAVIYKDIINNNLSVAYTHGTESNSN